MNQLDKYKKDKEAWKESEPSEPRLSIDDIRVSFGDSSLHFHDMKTYSMVSIPTEFVGDLIEWITRVTEDVVE